MEVTEVRVKLAADEQENLLAYCSVIFDDSFIVTDLKVIDGNNGVFVSMPSRKVMDRCPSCKGKNHIRARFCNECGRKLKKRIIDKKLYVDTAHPIKAECRQIIVDAVIEAYNSECSKGEQYDAVKQLGEKLSQKHMDIESDPYSGQLDPAGLDDSGIFQL